MILIQLQDNVRGRDSEPMPGALDQAEIEEGSGIHRSFASQNLTELEEDGIISSDLLHVNGSSRREKIYFVSDLGIPQPPRSRR